MTSTDLRSFYEKRKTAFGETLSSTRRRINLVSNVRLLTAAAFLLALYGGLTYHALLYGAVALLVVFVVLIRHHSKLFDEKTHLENLVKLNRSEEVATTGDHSLLDSGAAFIDPHHPYSHDLDIFGEGSLFQAVNRCNTLSGKTMFAARLSQPLATAEAIREHQQAARELSGKTEFRQHFQAAGMEAGEQAGDREQLRAWLRQPAFLYPKPVYRIGLIVLPALMAALIVGAFFVPILKSVAIVFGLVQLAILGAHVKSINVFHDYISRKKNILQKYARLLQVLQTEKFQAPLLQNIATAAHEADVKVKSLASLVSSLDARLNSMTMVFVNALFLYDLQCVYRLEKWKAINAGRLNAWLEAISETEVLCSLGTFAFNHPGFADAVIQRDLALEMRSLGHPLLRDDERVDNDLTMGRPHHVLIVTGANMAGKSTFLRALGVNLVLALNGAPVCAAEFRCPVIPLRTGMRTADSLKDHQSYFYAELDRLKTIMDQLRSGNPTLILLDEILKGTNSTDKQAGSISLVKQLLAYPSLAVIATHDLALGELEKEFPQHVKNYCFEATIENDQLSFDYKLKTGTAQKMNATFLMKKMGIIPA